MLWLSVSIFLFVTGKLLTIIIVGNDISLKGKEENLFYLFTFVIAILPPILFAFKFPVHSSPNDFLGYTLISLSLIALAKEQHASFIILMVLGIFCRETNLIVLAPFMFMSNISFLKRVLVTSFICIIFISYRLIWPGEYNPLIGAAHNYTYPIESLLFLFLVFAPFWFLGFFGYMTSKNKANLENNFIFALNKSFIFVTIFVLFIVWSFARVREIRIEYILFFYFIPYGILYCLSQLAYWKTIIKSYAFVVLLLITAIASFLTLVQFMPENENHHLMLEAQLAHFYRNFGGGWVNIFIGYFAITLILMFLSIYSAIVKPKI